MAGRSHAAGESFGRIPVIVTMNILQSMARNSFVIQYQSKLGKKTKYEKAFERSRAEESEGCAK